jgi:hypothetical protein
MVLDLAKARLDVIGMHDDVVVRVGDPEIICPDQDICAYRPEQACEVMALTGKESQWYCQEASKIWQSFLPSFARMCCVVMKQ